MIAVQCETTKPLNGIERFANAYACAFEKAFFKLVWSNPDENDPQMIKKLAGIIHHSICDELEANDLFRHLSYREYQQALELGIEKVRFNFNL
ncbi:MAG TPA: hypothetical protein VHK91_09065 [Flavisolibacter sp.]|jgi:hypothetical protein|nr:hypothetical protein [Flavisolibacter sp.]